MCAIQACVNSVNTEEEFSVVICSDNQAVLKALQGAGSTSYLVKETMLMLKQLSVVFAQCTNVTDRQMDRQNSYINIALCSQLLQAR